MKIYQASLFNREMYFYHSFFAFGESGAKESNNSAPSIAPYKVDLVGLDHIAQVPELHPTNFQ